MNLRLNNTLTNKTEEFHTLVPGKVSIYCCGVTVYDLCHLGHARSYISWDVLRRYLIWQGYSVKFVQNFTDIDDKILNRAKKENCSMTEISEKNIEEFHKDMDSLGILRPDEMPRATKCLDEIISLISELQASGAAYSIEGDVYFSVMKHKEYGKLSGRTIEEQQRNAKGRVKKEEEDRKKGIFDFALWKRAKSGEPSFISPWGEGRPGWHIECSAMVKKTLGETIDIHLGGSDLIFPHHENEIAQSESISNKKLSNYWLHNGMVNVSGQKMSKSSGNFTTIRAIIDSGISPMSLRLFILQAHYRKPIDFTEESIQAASKGWESINKALNLGTKYAQLLGWRDRINIEDLNYKNYSENIEFDLKNYLKKFKKAMDDDINTSAALAVIFELSRPLRGLFNRLEREKKSTINESEFLHFQKHWELLMILTNTMGFKAETEKDNLSILTKNNEVYKIEEAIERRRSAKLSRNFAEADKIRNELKAIGIELIDRPDGSTEWLKE